MRCSPFAEQKFLSEFADFELLRIKKARQENFKLYLEIWRSLQNKVNKSPVGSQKKSACEVAQHGFILFLGGRGKFRTLLCHFDTENERKEHIIRVDVKRNNESRVFPAVGNPPAPANV